MLALQLGANMSCGDPARLEGTRGARLANELRSHSSIRHTEDPDHSKSTLQGFLFNRIVGCGGQR